MRLIAHRGNLEGPNPSRENSPKYIQEALSLGFEVEVDVWLIGNQFFLGHDSPTYKIDKCFLFNKRIWSHAKNPEALLELSQYKDVNVFYQEKDEAALTSRGYIWCHSNGPRLTGPRSIITSLIYNEDLFLLESFAGVCSDYVEDFRYGEALIFGPAEGDFNKPPIDLVILDIDGVMTDGRKTYNLEGDVLGKTFCDLDFTAIKRFKAAGIKVCFLSGDTKVNQVMASVRGIDFYYARDPVTGNIDKSTFLENLCETYKTNPERVVYVGDDYYDLSIIENLKHTFCPSTAIQDIKARVSKVLDCPGGHGVVAKLYEHFSEDLNYNFPTSYIKLSE